MRVIQFADYGAPGVLHEADHEIPPPSKGAVRIRVAAAGVNPADHKWRGGMFRGVVPVLLPHVLGYDVAGTIDAVGPDVSGLMVGDEVFAMLDPVTKGGYAEFAIAGADQVARLPAGLAFETAAALPTPALAGYQLIRDHIRPRTGETVLVTGAAGAAGRFAIRAALDMGARVVAAVRASQQALARDLGAAEVLVLGHGETEAPHFDHVADLVGGDAVAALCRRLPAAARIVTMATTPIDPRGLACLPKFAAVKPDGAMLAALGRMVASGRVTVDPPCVMGLTDAALAHERLEAGDSRKIVLRP